MPISPDINGESLSAELEEISVDIGTNPIVLESLEELYQLVFKIPELQGIFQGLDGQELIEKSIDDARVKTILKKFSEISLAFAKVNVPLLLQHVETLSQWIYDKLSTNKSLEEVVSYGLKLETILDTLYRARSVL